MKKMILIGLTALSLQVNLLPLSSAATQVTPSPYIRVTCC